MKLDLLIPLIGAGAMTIGFGVAFPAAALAEPKQEEPEPEPTPPEPEPVAEDFSTDPWSTIIYYANKGIDELAAAYKCQPTDFIKKTRDLTLTQLSLTGELVDLTYEVIVVDVNKDTTTDGKKAALTWQFVPVYCDPDFEEEIVIPFHFNTEDAMNIWQDCSLRHFLQNGFKLQFPEELQEAIKTVKKVTARAQQYEETGGPSTYETNETIFLPSLVEIYGATNLENSDYNFTQADLPYYLQEGEQYAIYKDITSMDPYYDCSQLIKYDMYPEAEDYWLRSPVINPSDLVSTWYYSWTIYDTGSAGEMPVLDETDPAIAPMFCI